MVMAIRDGSCLRSSRRRRRHRRRRSRGRVNYRARRTADLSLLAIGEETISRGLMLDLIYYVCEVGLGDRAREGMEPGEGLLNAILQVTARQSDLSNRGQGQELEHRSGDQDRSREHLVRQTQT